MYANEVKEIINIISFRDIQIMLTQPLFNDNLAILRTRICHIVNVGHVRSIKIQIICRKIMQNT